MTFQWCYHDINMNYGVETGDSISAIPKSTYSNTVTSGNSQTSLTSKDPKTDMTDH